MFLPVKEVLYCESDNNYTQVVATQNRKFLLTRTLRDVQEVLEEQGFVRVHRQYLINIEHIKMLMKNEGTYLIMSNEANIPVARNQKDKLMQQFGWI